MQKTTTPLHAHLSTPESVLKIPGIQNLAPVLKSLRDDGRPAHISEQLGIYDSTTKITADTKKKVAAYLDPLLDHARKFLPHDRIKSIPLFILATGGMRRHKQERYEEYMILRDAITEYINNSGFRDPVYDTISGEDEALYGWVAANYVDGLLKPEAIPHGFMEMGGESAQFAVSINESDFGSYEGLLRMVTIWGKDYMVFVKTWMGLGVDSAWKRHQARLRESESAIPLDPCLPKGFAYRLSGSDKIVQGTGDFVGCMKEALSLLSCPDKDCAMGNLCIYRSKQDVADDDPRSVGCLLRDNTTGNPIINFDKNEFCGASVYWHATHGIFTGGSSEGGGGKENFSAFWDTVVEFSEHNWEKLKAKRPRERKTGYKFLEKGFFTAAMIMSTLFLGFGIPMPLQAVETARSFAMERSEQAKYAAQDALEEAMEKSKVADAAFSRAVGAVESAEQAERDTYKKKEKEDQRNNGLSEEDIAHDIAECKALFQARPSEANRQDFVDVVDFRVSAGDNLIKRTEAARTAREKRRAAGGEAKEAYDELATAKSKLRRAIKVETELANGSAVDGKLNGTYEAQSGVSKYTSIKDAYWTLGRIVLHVNQYKPDIRTRRGWKE